MKPYQHLWSMTAILSALLICNLAVQLVNAQQGPQAPLVLSAREFRLVNQANQTLATMGVGRDGGPQIALFNNRQQKRLELAVGGDGQPLIQLNDGAGEPRLQLQTFAYKGDDSAPHISIFNREGQVRGQFHINQNNRPNFYLVNDAGAQIQLSPETLSLRSGRSSAGTTLAAYDEKTPGLVFADSEGKWMWTAPKKAAPKKK